MKMNKYPGGAAGSSHDRPPMSAAKSLRGYAAKMRGEESNPGASADESQDKAAIFGTAIAMLKTLSRERPELAERADSVREELQALLDEVGDGNGDGDIEQTMPMEEQEEGLA